MKYILSLLCVTLFSFASAQEVKLFYNDQGELTLPELASHYRNGSFSLSLKKFTGKVYEYRKDSSLLAEYTYSPGGELEKLMLFGTEKDTLSNYLIKKGNYKGLPEPLELSINNKHQLKQALYIRKNDYQHIRHLLPPLPDTTFNKTIVHEGKEITVREIFDIVEIPPQFPGGRETIGIFLSHYLVYPKDAVEKGATGVVEVRFLILPDGSIGDAEAITSVGYGCDEAAVAAIKRLPDWIPGTQRGKPVTVRMVIPIVFK